MKNGYTPQASIKAFQPGGRILGVGITIPILCNCGHPDIIIVAFSSTGPQEQSCPRCKTTFILARLSFDAQDNGKLSAALGVKSPSILPPQAAELPRM